MWAQNTGYVEPRKQPNHADGLSLCDCVWYRDCVSFSSKAVLLNVQFQQQ